MKHNKLFIQLKSSSETQYMLSYKVVAFALIQVKLWCAVVAVMSSVE